MLWSKFIKFLMSILNWQGNSSSNFASFFIVMTHNSPTNFKVMHFLLWIRESLQSPNFETFECSGGNLPNSSCHFSNHKSVFFQILHQPLEPSNITLLYFLTSNIIYIAEKQPIKVQNYEISKCSGQNSLNSSCQFWTDKSIPLQIFNHCSLSWHP